MFFYKPASFHERTGSLIIPPEKLDRRTDQDRDLDNIEVARKTGSSEPKRVKYSPVQLLTRSKHLHAMNEFGRY